MILKSVIAPSPKLETVEEVLEAGQEKRREKSVDNHPSIFNLTDKSLHSDQENSLYSFTISYSFLNRIKECCITNFIEGNA